MTDTLTKPRPEARESARTRIVCAREGCGNYITEVARSHGDPFCSRACAYPQAEAERHCVNCGAVIVGRALTATMCEGCAQAKTPGRRERIRAEAIATGQLVPEPEADELAEVGAL